MACYAMASDIPLPHLAIHGWITRTARKCPSPWATSLTLRLGERYGCDAIRYHILREMASARQLILK